MDKDGIVLDIPPTTLIVAPTLEWTARALISSSLVNRDSTSDKQAMSNPLQGICGVQVEPRLERGCVNPRTGATIAGSTTAWFLFVGPVDLPFIFASTGAGEGPTIQQFGFDADPNRLAISFRAHADFGAAVGEYRASVYSTGA